MTTLAPTTLATTVAPSTIASTTLAPTTVLTTLAPTTTLTTLAPTTAGPDTDITLDPIEIEFSFYFTGSTSTPISFDPALSTYKTLSPLVITISVEGSNSNLGIVLDPIEITLSQEGSLCSGEVIEASPIYVYITPSFDSVLIPQLVAAFVRWSKIGSLDFELDNTNVAGYRPMDWPGAVYEIKKLGKLAIVYGSGGISAMIPSGISYGLDDVHPLGIKNKGAIAGDSKKHFFVDSSDNLYVLLSDGLKKLGYEEYLSLMTTITLSYDKKNSLVYICDGTYGFIYEFESGSFGEGPVNVTGIDSDESGTLVVSDIAIAEPVFEVCTDIYDFGTRKPKTIYAIEVGSNLAQRLYVSVEYRTSYRDDFKQIGWFLVNPNGKAFPRCYGVEFRFRLKSEIYEYFEIDYIKIKGHIHGYSFLDTAVG